MSNFNDPQAVAATAPPPQMLGYLSLAGEEVPAPTRENAYLLQQAADFRVGQRTLRKSGIWDIVWGVIIVASGASATRFSVFTVAILIIGLMLIAVGVWIALAPAPLGLIFDGIALIIVGLWNGGIFWLNLTYAPKGHSPNGYLPIIAIAQFAWGIQRLVKYRRFAEAAALRPSPQLTKWLDDTIKSISKSKPADNPQAIEFHFKPFSGLQVWKALLLPDLAILVRDKILDFRLLPRESIQIRQIGKVMMQKRLKAEIVLGKQKGKGTISPLSMERYEQWAGAVPSAAAVPPPVPTGAVPVIASVPSSGV